MAGVGYWPAMHGRGAGCVLAGHGLWRFALRGEAALLVDLDGGNSFVLELLDDDFGYSVRPDPVEQQPQERCPEPLAASTGDDVELDLGGPIRLHEVVDVPDELAGLGVEDVVVALTGGRERESGLESRPVALGPVDAAGDPVVAGVGDVPARVIRHHPRICQPRLPDAELVPWSAHGGSAHPRH